MGKKQRKQIWLDITDLESWTGHFTGIQRVVYEIGSRLVDHGDFTLRCVVYDEVRKKFFEASDDILRLSEDTSETSSLENSVEADLKLKFKHYAKSAAHRLPPLIKGPVIRTYHYTRHRVGTIKNEAVYPLYRKVRAAVVAGGTEATIAANDTVLILGAGWHKRSMIDSLAERKSKDGFDVAVLIHDAIPIIKPEFFGPGLQEVYAEFMFEALAMASVVFSISKSTTRDIESFCEEMNITLPRIVLVREGDGFKKNIHPVKPGLLSTSTYILAVGSFEARKNYTLLYQVAKQAQLEGRKLPQIVIVGRHGFLAYDLTYLLQADTSNPGVTHLSNVSDAELSWLYENALFTVYPSVYEGWGLPIAESLFYGKFCISSNTSSMPEIGGDLLDYVSPYDTVGWLNSIAAYSEDREKLKSREERIKKEYKPTPWDDTAALIISALS